MKDLDQKLKRKIENESGQINQINFRKQLKEWGFHGPKTNKV